VEIGKPVKNFNKIGLTHWSYAKVSERMDSENRIMEAENRATVTGLEPAIFGSEVHHHRRQIQYNRLVIHK